MPIAIIGIGCRFPGGVDSAEALWRALAGERDLVTEVPPERWDADAGYDPEPGVPGKVASRWGGFITDVAGFEPEFFGLTEHEAERMDPQSRLLLETAHEALEHAGLPPRGLSGSATGVFAGHGHNDYLHLMSDEPGRWDAHSVLGTAHAPATARISSLLGLRGPAVTLDTGCSSSLVAVHLGCQSLRTGEVDLALAGGVALALTPEHLFASATLGTLSPGRRCRAFSAGADGSVRGEGCGMVALKRLPDAVAAGDRVLAVLRGTGVATTGRSPDATTGTCGQAQHLLQREVLARAGVDPARVGLVETHGTGVPAADAIEYAALHASYGAGEEGCALGAVTTNLGHCETAAGMAGLIKAAMALRHGLIPANLHFSGWNPEIDPAGGRLFVPTALTPWPVAGGPRLAAVSARDLSGTDTHVILEQAPPAAVSSYDLSDTGAHVVLEQAPSAAVSGGPQEPAGPRLYPISAGSDRALAAAAGRVADWLGAEGAKVPLTDVGFTLAHRRTTRSHRAVVLAGCRTELAGRLRRLAEHDPDDLTWTGTSPRRDRGPVWVFPGEGAGWAGMGRFPLSAEPAFAETVDALEPLVAAGAGFSLRAALTAGEPVTGAARVPPVLFATQVALAAAWRDRGVEPAAVIGHSTGEVAAAVVAGALSLADGAAVVCHRAALLARVPGPGAMARVGLPSRQVAAQLAAAGVEDAGVAAILTPSATVVSGAAGRVQALVAAWHANDVAATIIAVDVASHSAQVDAVLPGLRAAPGGLAPSEPDVPFYGTVLDEPRATPAFDAGYWAHNVRRPVRFAAACAAALADGHRTFIEISPRPLLTDVVRENAAHAGRAATVLPTLVERADGRRPGPAGAPGRAGTASLAALAAAAYCAGVPLSWREHARGGLADVPLPPWAKRPLWLPEYLRKKPGGGQGPGRPLLGVHIRLPDSPDEDLWQADVGTARRPWLRDHQVDGRPAMPAAGYAEMALEVAADLFGEATLCEVRDLAVHSTLFPGEHTALTTRGVRAPDGVSVQFLTGAGGQASCVAGAVVRRLAADSRAERMDLPAALAGRPPAADPTAIYEGLGHRGIRRGPCFAALRAVHLPGAGGDTVIARVALPAGLRAGAGAFRAHPVLLDACVQAIWAHPAVAGQDAALLPVRVGRLRRLGDPAHASWCEVRVHEAGPDGVRADARLLTEDGTVVTDLTDVFLDTAAGGGFAARAGHRMPAIEWDEVCHPGLPGPATGSWLVLAEKDDQVADALAGALGSALLEAPLSYLETGAQAVRRHLTDEHSRVVMLCPAPLAGTGADGVERARDRVHRLTDLVRTLAEVEGRPRLYVVTREASTAPGTVVPNLEQAPLRAVCRVAGTEHPGLHVTHVDIDADGGDPADLAAELLADSAEDDVAWRAGTRYAARLRRAPLREDERRTTDARLGVDGIVPAVRRPGDLDSLELRTSPRREPGTGEIEVRVHAAGLTFRDVLGALDRGPGASAPLGLDCAGEIVAVGAGVRDLCPGDRVAAVTPGAMASFVTLPATGAFRIPPALSYEEAATIPVAYLLAAHAVRHLARLQPGERILIQSATGAVGMAVIALARAAGARIHATAGTAERRDLLRGMGLEHVYDSRTLDFTDQVRSVTDGEGVDVVVNAQGGRALRAALDLLRPGGRFIHIGVSAGGTLGLAPFRGNVTFAGVDLAATEGGPLQPAGALTREIGADLEAGRIRPLPHTAYPIDSAGCAFHAMAAREHVGKLVIVFPREGTVQAVVPPDQVPVVRADGAYLITGGLGVHGLRLARHLAGSGAGRIVLQDRARPAGEAAETLAELRRAGTDIQVIRADLADSATAPQLVAAAMGTGLTLRGVAHADGVAEEAAIACIDGDLLDRVWAPKALGAWHLFQAAGNRRLDWWLSCSSVASLIGSRGQGAYAAASGWLDAFTAYCRSRGVPARGVNWGADGGAGNRGADGGGDVIWGPDGGAGNRGADGGGGDVIWGPDGDGDNRAAAGGGDVIWGPDGDGDNRAAAGDGDVIWGPDGDGDNRAAAGDAHARIGAAEAIAAIDLVLRHDRAQTGYLSLDEARLLIGDRALTTPYFAALTRRHPLDGEGDDLRIGLHAADPGARHTRITEYLVDRSSAILRCDREALDPDSPLSESGLDSLMALRLRTGIERDLGIRLPARAVWDHPTPAALAAHLADRL